MPTWGDEATVLLWAWGDEGGEAEVVRLCSRGRGEIREMRLWCSRSRGEMMLWCSCSLRR